MKTLYLGFFILVLATAIRAPSNDEEFKISDFLKMKEDYCQVPCPEWDHMCLKDIIRFNKCVEENETCNDYKSNINEEDQTLPFNQEAQDNCYQICSKEKEEEEDISVFYEQFIFNCDKTVGNNEIPVYQYPSEEDWDIQKYIDQIEKCQDQAPEPRKNEDRYKNAAQKFAQCYQKGQETEENQNKSFCKDSFTHLLSLSLNEQIPYQSAVCDDSCAPDKDRSSEGYSELFVSVYNCWRSEDAVLSYDEAKEPEEVVEEEEKPVTEEEEVEEEEEVVEEEEEVVEEEEEVVEEEEEVIEEEEEVIEEEEEVVEEEEEEEVIEEEEEVVEEEEEVVEEEEEEESEDGEIIEKELNAGNFQQITFENQKDIMVYKFSVQKDTFDYVLLNLEIPAKFSNLEMSLKIQGQNTDLNDINIENRNSQNILSISNTDLKNEQCQNGNKCEFALKISLKKQFDGKFEKNKPVAILQYIFQNTYEEYSTEVFSMPVFGPSNLSSESLHLYPQQDSIFYAISQNYNQRQYAKYLYLIKSSSKENAENFVHISDDSREQIGLWVIAENMGDVAPSDIEKDWPKFEESQIELFEDNMRHYNQELLNPCTEEECWYAISVYIRNPDKSHGAFYIGLQAPELRDLHYDPQNEKAVSSNVDVNKYVVAFKFVLESVRQKSFNVDIDPKDHIEDETYVYTVLAHQDSVQLLDLYVDQIGEYSSKTNQQIPYQFATVSPIKGTYYIFYYFGHINTDRSIYIRPDNKEDQYKPLFVKQSQFQLRVDEKVKDYVMYQNIPNIEFVPHKKYEIYLAKSSDLQTNLAYVNPEVVEYVVGGPIPEFQMADRIYMDTLKDDNDNYILSMDLGEYEACEVACSLFLRFGYNGDIPSDQSEILAIKTEVPEHEKIQLQHGNFREIQLSDYFDTETMESIINPQAEDFTGLVISAQNFEMGEMSYTISFQGINQVEDKIIKAGDKSSQVLQTFSKSKLQEANYCATHEDCKIVMKIKKSSPYMFFKPVSASVQFILQQENDGSQVWGPVRVPYVTDNLSHKPISQSYQLRDSSVQNGLTYDMFHFDVYAQTGEQKLINIMQATKDKAKFYIIGVLDSFKDTDYPIETKENLESYLSGNDNYSTGRFILDECVQKDEHTLCKYFITVYIQYEASNPSYQSRNSFYLEAQVFRNTMAHLQSGQDFLQTTNPDVNFVLQSFELDLTRLEQALNRNFHIDINETLNKDSQIETLNDIEDPEDPEDELPAGRGTYVVCYYDKKTHRNGQNLRVIDTFKTGQSMGIMKPLDMYFVFYYTHSTEDVDYRVSYKDNGLDKIFEDLHDHENKLLSFTYQKSEYLHNFVIQHVTTNKVEVTFSMKDTDKPIDQFAAQVVAYGHSQKNQIFPTNKEKIYTSKDFAGSKNQRTWTIENLPMGCSLGCNMMFRFGYEEAYLDTTPVNVIVEAREIFPEEAQPGKSKLGLILGLTFGILVVVAVAAFFILRYQRRKQQNHLNYQDMEYEKDDESVQTYQEEE